MHQNISLPDDVEFSGQYNGSIFYKYTDFICEITRLGFEYVSRGSFRAGYRRHNIIIKVPINGDGLIDNIVEAVAWRKYKNRPTNRHIYLAPCRLLSNHCLMMARVEIGFDRGAPAWAKNLIDAQYGNYRNKKNEQQIVTYDYAFEVTERFEIERKLGTRSQFWGSHRWRNERQSLKEDPLFVPSE